MRPEKSIPSPGTCWAAAQRAPTSPWSSCGSAPGAGGVVGEESGCFILFFLTSLLHGDGYRLLVPRNIFTRSCIDMTFLLGGKLYSIYCPLLPSWSSRSCVRLFSEQQSLNTFFNLSHLLFTIGIKTLPLSTGGRQAQSRAPCSSACLGPEHESRVVLGIDRRFLLVSRVYAAAASVLGTVTKESCSVVMLAGLG